MTTAGGASFAAATDLSALDLTALTTDVTSVAGLGDVTLDRTLHNVAWWKITVPTGGLVSSLDTNQSPPVGDDLRDTVLTMYQLPSGGTTQADLVFFAANDDRSVGDGTDDATSFINLNLVDAGSVYYVLVSSFAADPSPLTGYVLTWGAGGDSGGGGGGGGALYGVIGTMGDVRRGFYPRRPS